EALGLPHLAVGPESPPAAGRLDLQALAHEAHGGGLANGGLPVEIVPLPLVPHQAGRSAGAAAPAINPDRSPGRGAPPALRRWRRRTAPAAGCARGRADLRARDSGR